MRLTAASATVTLERQAAMSILTGIKKLRWRVVLPAPRERVYQLLTTDAGRERFWAERSRQNAQHVELSFPDGTITSMAVLDHDPPGSFAVQYFGVRTTFTLSAVAETSTLLEVVADDVAAEEHTDIAAGWVSVLLCLKAHVVAGIDLRNHDAHRSWRDGFIDN